MQYVASIHIVRQFIICARQVHRSILNTSLLFRFYNLQQQDYYLVVTMQAARTDFYAPTFLTSGTRYWLPYRPCVKMAQPHSYLHNKNLRPTSITLAEVVLKPHQSFLTICLPCYDPLLHSLRRPSICTDIYGCGIRTA